MFKGLGLDFGLCAGLGLGVGFNLGLGSGFSVFSYVSINMGAWFSMV